MTILDAIKVSWPILVALILVTVWLANVASSARNNEKHLQEFKDNYSKDRNSLSGGIKEVKEAQEKSEEKLELKLDQFSNKTDAQLSKLYDQINQANNSLAEMKGRLYSKSSEGTT